MLTTQTINGVLFAPVFFFFSVVLYLLSALMILASFQGAASLVVFSCVSFVLGYNSWKFGQKLRAS